MLSISKNRNGRFSVVGSTEAIEATEERYAILRPTMRKNIGSFNDELQSVLEFDEVHRPELDVFVRRDRPRFDEFWCPKEFALKAQEWLWERSIWATHQNHPDDVVFFLEDATATEKRDFRDYLKSLEWFVG